MDFHFAVWGLVPKQPSLLQKGKEKFHSQILGKKNPVCCLFIYLESTYSNARGGDRDADQVRAEKSSPEEEPDTSCRISSTSL